MIDKLIIWLQLFSVLLLLSDAYLSRTLYETLDNKLKARVGEFSETYRQRYLKRDLVFFILILGLWAGFFLIGGASRFVGAWVGTIGPWGILIFLIWASALLFLLATAMAGLTNHLDRHLNLLIKFPLCFALYKAPKGPIYALGFMLLFVSHVIQLFIEYEIFT